MESYTYTGNIVMLQSWPQDGTRVRLTCRDGEGAPAMFEAAGKLGRYAKELMLSESAERYARKVFHFDRWCFLSRIDVLDEGGAAVRSVDDGNADRRPFWGETEDGEEGVMDSG